MISPSLQSTLYSPKFLNNERKTSKCHGDLIGVVLVTVDRDRDLRMSPYEDPDALPGLVGLRHYFVL